MAGCLTLKGSPEPLSIRSDDCGKKALSGASRCRSQQCAPPDNCWGLLIRWACLPLTVWCYDDRAFIWFSFWLVVTVGGWGLNLTFWLHSHDIACEGGVMKTTQRSCYPASASIAGLAWRCLQYELWHWPLCTEAVMVGQRRCTMVELSLCVSLSVRLPLPLPLPLPPIYLSMSHPQTHRHTHTHIHTLTLTHKDRPQLSERFPRLEVSALSALGQLARRSDEQVRKWLSARQMRASSKEVTLTLVLVGNMPKRASIPDYEIYVILVALSQGAALETEQVGFAIQDLDWSLFKVSYDWA